MGMFVSSKHQMKQYLKKTFCSVAGLLPICSAISVMSKSAPWLLSLVMSLPVAVGLLSPWILTSPEYQWTFLKWCLFYFIWLFWQRLEAMKMNESKWIRLNKITLNYLEMYVFGVKVYTWNVLNLFPTVALYHEDRCFMVL